MFYRYIALTSTDLYSQKSSIMHIVPKHLLFYLKKRPLYGLRTSFLMEWTEVVPSSEDSAKKFQFQINCWRNKLVDCRAVNDRSKSLSKVWNNVWCRRIWTSNCNLYKIIGVRLLKIPMLFLMGLLFEQLKSMKRKKSSISLSS